MKRLLPLLFALFGSGACSEPSEAQPAPRRGEASATFAGGCFWCTEADFEKVPGVTAAVSGYTGGRTRKPTYGTVTAGGTGHYEAVRITYDSKRVSYAALVRHFFRTIDPLDAGGQFCDRGSSYRTAIWAANAEERRIAEAEKASVEKLFKRKVVTPVLAAAPFWTAEGYHQDYYRKNNLKYRFYRSRCGRDPRLRELWGSKG